MSSANRDARRSKRGLRNRQHQALSAEEQRRKDIQAEINRQLRRWPPRRILAWALLVLAGVIAVQHIFAHLGFRPLPLSMPAQDLLVGYPMAAFLVIAAAFVMDPRPK